ncbi:MAG: Gfo/Idh/MocA family oxidoreductase [Kiritimatiellae bacterium]|nr:Gfo/Idh/MocA family oxidoreductase [Kiritimatiellia bacterium]
MKTVRFGIIGLGMMGREFASAIARWCHLTDINVRPEIVAVCNRTDGPFAWFRRNFAGIRQMTQNYRDLLANPEVDAVYCAVPHHLHEEIYSATIEAGKHLLGEKPFGINKRANDAIMASIERHPNVFVRCSSEFPFFPAVQAIGRMIEAGGFGRLLEVNAGFLHSSDLNPNKPINWKRMVRFNGEYGCLGDLGMHVCHVPFRAGWYPRNVRAVLAKVVTERPDNNGTLVPCDTWDNATLLCEAVARDSGEVFPFSIRTQRIAPGEVNTWYLEIKGMQGCARWSTKNPRTLELLKYENGEQAWRQIDTGWESAFASITSRIFEFGFTDAIQQMCAAFLYELTEGKPKSRFAGCVTPEEVAYSHRLFTAALKSHLHGTVETI